MTLGRFPSALDRQVPAPQPSSQEVKGLDAAQRSLWPPANAQEMLWFSLAANKDGVAETPAFYQPMRWLPIKAWLAKRQSNGPCSIGSNSFVLGSF